MEFINIEANLSEQKEKKNQKEKNNADYGAKCTDTAKAKKEKGKMMWIIMERSRRRRGDIKSGFLKPGMMKLSDVNQISNLFPASLTHWKITLKKKKKWWPSLWNKI